MPYYLFIVIRYIVLKLKILDLIYFYFYFSIYFLIFGLRVWVSIISYVTVTYTSQVTVTSHMIMCHTEKCKKF